MIIKPVSNPYGLRENKPFFLKLAFFATFVAALVDTFLFFPLVQMMQANLAPHWLVDLVGILGELVSVAALFTIFSLVVVATFTEEKGLVKTVLLREAVAMALISTLARMLLYWGSAVLDAKLAISFKFNNSPLSVVIGLGQFGVIIQSVISLINLLLVLVWILLAAFFVKKAYGKGKRGVPSLWMKRIPVFIYLGAALLSAIPETILTVINQGISSDFAILFDLAIPYLEIGLFTVLGFYFLSYLVEHFEKE